MADQVGIEDEQGLEVSKWRQARVPYYGLSLVAPPKTAMCLGSLMATKALSPLSVVSPKDNDRY